MKSHKTMLLAGLALVLAFAVTVAAGGDEKMKKLKAELNLTDAQVTQLEQRFTELEPLSARAKAVKTDLKALETAANPDTRAIAAKKTELDGIKKEWKGKAEAIYRSVLTSEQFTKFQAMQRAEYEKQKTARN